MGHYYILKEDKEGGGGQLRCVTRLSFHTFFALIFHTLYVYTLQKSRFVQLFMDYFFLKEGATMERL